VWCGGSRANCPIQRASDEVEAVLGHKPDPNNPVEKQLMDDRYIANTSLAHEEETGVCPSVRCRQCLKGPRLRKEFKEVFEGRGCEPDSTT
jgi:hypothetical protein